ncbi:G5 domain-containing protein [Bifidobacterium samirii]|uniref:Lytic transglycosylase n=1 Tax=Bifidobacterium samirii TaxID=2306974 RepID=A0A430FV61_9BIFI|nr:G5 domain-containing protein [Bifidobacterium samirii]RSX57445.1 lytic transglycosylase [Bifidobacterium samirii]
MARRWTPQRFARLRRIRVAACALSVTAMMVGTFAVGARKTVAVTVNGETTTVVTYAMSAQRLLARMGVDVKTHDLVESSAGGDRLTDHAVVTVQSAYQTTITIDGQRVPFWTTATSAAQLLGFFEANEHAAAKITVDIGNIYNKLTGGMVIDADGPVTVIADGKTSVAPNGKLPAASILDAKGITVGKDDRVSVERDGDETILRVQRVTVGQETRMTTVTHGTQTVVDPSLAPGESVVRQQGEDGRIRQVYDVTYVDGEVESETLASETVVKLALDTIIAVGPSSGSNGSDDAAGSGGTPGSSGGSMSGGSGATGGSSGATGGGSSDSGTSGGTTGGDGGSNDSGDGGSGTTGGSTDDAGNGGGTSGGGSNDSGNSGGSGDDSGGSSNGGSSSGGSDDAGNSGGNSGGSSSGGSSDSGSSSGGSGGSSDGSSTARLWHPTPAQAQAYAAGAAAQRGWTGDDWDCLVKLWNRESNWRWDAENASSGAYGIPQALPADKMAVFGADWRDDAAIQIDWGLAYIAERYGSPSKAWQHSEEVGWY